MTMIKICGVTTIADGEMVARSGADWMGLNFWPGSKRRVAISDCRAIAQIARITNPRLQVVGVFVNQTIQEIEETDLLVEFDYIQLHGEESPDFAASLGSRAIKAIPMTEATDLDTLATFKRSWVLLDNRCAERGGSGEVADWKLASQAVGRHSRLWLAGGLTPENVGEAIGQVHPLGVDVASGVESSPGIKDAALLKEFVSAVRSAR